jgi:hypothetical protein
MVKKGKKEKRKSKTKKKLTEMPDWKKKQRTGIKKFLK